MKGLFLLFFVFSIALSAVNAVSLKRLKTIGDEQENHTFFTLTGAVLSKDKNIYVLDGKGLFIAQYNWSGKFIRKTGQKGQGPSDFYFPRSLAIYKDKLLLLDSGNRRIARCDLNLKKFDYIQMPRDHKFSSHVVELNNKMFLGNFSDFREGRGRLGIINPYGDLEQFFFNEFPIEFEFDAQKITDAEKRVTNVNNFKWMLKHRVISNLGTPVFAVDEQRKQVLVSFRNPDNPIKFFIYTIEGKKVKEFQYTIQDKRYRFSDFLLNATWNDIRNPKKYPKKRFDPVIFSLYVYKNHYIVNLWLEDYERKELIRRRGFCLVFDEKGKLKGKIEVQNAIRFFSISPDGYLLASGIDEEITKLYIFKLDLG